MQSEGPGLIVPPDGAAMERLRMDAVAKRNMQKAVARRPVADAINGATVQPGSNPGAVWRQNLAQGMGAFQLMDGAKRNAFLKGVAFATSSLQLAAVATEANGAPSAAAAFRHLAAQIDGAALGMRSIPRGKVRKRR